MIINELESQTYSTSFMNEDDRTDATISERYEFKKNIDYSEEDGYEHI